MLTWIYLLLYNSSLSKILSTLHIIQHLVWHIPTKWFSDNQHSCVIYIYIYIYDITGNDIKFLTANVETTQSFAFNVFSFFSFSNSSHANTFVFRLISTENIYTFISLPAMTFYKDGFGIK